MASAGVARISMACQCTSMRPGINVRPPPSITRVPASTVIGLVEMRSILLPRTSTLEAPESVELFPSKMRTFWKSVASLSAGGVRCASPGGKRATSATSIKIEGSKRPRTRDLAVPNRFLNRVYDPISLSPACVVVRLQQLNASAPAHIPRAIGHASSKRGWDASSIPTCFRDATREFEVGHGVDPGRLTLLTGSCSGTEVGFWEAVVLQSCRRMTKKPEVN